MNLSAVIFAVALPFSAGFGMALLGFSFLTTVTVGLALGVLGYLVSPDNGGKLAEDNSSQR